MPGMTSSMNWGISSAKLFCLPFPVRFARLTAFSCVPTEELVSTSDMEGIGKGGDHARDCGESSAVAPLPQTRNAQMCPEKRYLLRYLSSDSIQIGYRTMRSSSDSVSQRLQDHEVCARLSDACMLSNTPEVTLTVTSQRQPRSQG